MSNRPNTSNDKPKTIEDIIREIETKSKGGGYIYRGERKCNPNVSSKLYRDFEIEAEHFNIELVQKEILVAAKRHTGSHPHDYRVADYARNYSPSGTQRRFQNSVSTIRDLRKNPIF